MDIVIIGTIAILGLADVWCDRVTGVSLVERLAALIERGRNET